MKTKVLKGFENYIIQEDGVYSLRTKKLIKVYLNKDGYPEVRINYKRFRVHRLLAIAFLPNPENKPQVNHINGIKTDNRLENLEWVTCQENLIHSFKNGLSKRLYGEKSRSHKLNNADIERIFQLSKQGNSQRKIATELKVHQSNISLILNKKIWNYGKV